MVNFKNVTKRFGSHEVLRGLSLSVEKGETTALLGLSGSGKTTALKLICGLHTADEGEVMVNGLQLSPSTLLETRRNMGYVIQDGGLFPHLTAEENIRIVGKEAGWESSRLQSRISELADLTKLPLSLLKRFPRELSGGQRQRVGLMRALFLDPAILLLDEPLGALDPITRAELQDELKELFKALHRTVVLVTHDLFEAGYLADNIFLLREGRIAQSGSMEELIRKPADDFVARFVRSQRRDI